MKISSSGGTSLMKPTPLGCRNPPPCHHLSPDHWCAQLSMLLASLRATAASPSAAEGSQSTAATATASRCAAVTSPDLHAVTTSSPHLRATAEVSPCAPPHPMPCAPPSPRFGGGSRARRRPSQRRRQPGSLLGPVGPGRPPLLPFF